MMKILSKPALVISIALLSQLQPAFAQENFPTRSVRIVVAQAAGGGPDILARLVAQELNTKWKQPVIVDNRPGAAGGIAAEIVAKSAPDGYTLLMGSAGIMAIAPAIGGKIPYAPEEFIPLAHVASLSNVFVVSPGSGIKSMSGLIAASKAKPGGLSYATLGTGSTNQIASAMFLQSASLEGIEVAYKGDTLGITDLLGGHIQFMAANMSNALPQIKSGALTALAVTGAHRSPHLPDVPTVAESGLKGYEVAQWYSLYAPAATPKNVAAKIIAATKTVLAQPSVQKQILATGMELSNEAQSNFPAFDKAEKKKWGDFVRANPGSLK